MRERKAQERLPRGSAFSRMSRLAAALLWAIPVAAPSQAAPSDWLTYRGSSNRSGCLDGIEVPGPPEILWILPGENHYLAAPTPASGKIFLPGLGAFNTPLVVALSQERNPAKRISWLKQPPAIGLPSACSPVVVGDLVILGEGMHQTAGGAAVAFSAEDGLRLWRMELPGELRHVEGSPTVHGNRLFFGCGSGGVVCMGLDKVRFEEREMTVADASRAIRRRWKELLAAYEREKMEDPDFAVPPSDSDLPSGTVTTLWTAGEDRWHVDAPVAVAGDRLVVGSAYLDHEKRGDRSLLCLDTDDGLVLWRVPLRWNPWGGPSVADSPHTDSAPSRVLVACSSVRYDPAGLAGALGEVVAVELGSGRLVWRRSIPGGVLSPVAIDQPAKLGLITATDGKVRALRIDTGEVVWSRGGTEPYFAGPALAGTQAYVVDLNGGVRALETATGEELWRLDLGIHPRVGLPGRVYASPVCAGGRLYVATCNLEGPQPGSPTVVVCIGERAERPALAQGVHVDRERRRVSIDAAVAPRKLPHLDRVYPIEVLVTRPDGKKAHETVLVTEVELSSVHRALESLGLVSGSPGLGDKLGTGPEVKLFIEFLGPAGLTKRLDVARSVVDHKTGLPLGKTVRWRFTGSSLVRPDPEREEQVYGADFTGTLVTLFPVTRETVLQSSLGPEAEPLLDLEVASSLPPPGTAVKLVIEAQPDTRKN